MLQNTPLNANVLGGTPELKSVNPIYDLYLKTEMTAQLAYEPIINPNFTISTSPVKLSFNIPNRPINLYNTIFQGDLSVAGTALLATVFFTDRFPCQNVTLTSRKSGIQLANLSNVQLLTQGPRYAATKSDDYFNREGVITSTTIANAEYTQCNFLQPNGGSQVSVINPTVATTTAIGATFSATVVGNDYTLTAPLTPITSVLTPGVDSLLIPGVATAQYWNPNTYAVTEQRLKNYSPQMIAAGIINNVSAMRFSFKLGEMFPGTIFAMDKVMYLDSELLLEITLLPRASWYLKSPLNTTVTANIIAADTDITVTNSYLYLCEDTNQEAINQIVNKVRNEGMICAIPYTLCETRNIDVTGAVINSRRLSSGDGSYLKRVMMVSSLAALTYPQDTDSCVNSAATLYNNIQTSINGKQLQMKPVDVLLGEDWNLYQNKFKDSAMVSAETFRLHSFFMDDFDVERSVDWISKDTTLSGLKLGSNPIDYVSKFDATTYGGTSGNIAATFYVLVKLLTVGPNTLRFE